MAWNTTTPMDERIDLISDYHTDGYSLAALARLYGVSRKCAAHCRAAAGSIGRTIWMA